MAEYLCKLGTSSGHVIERTIHAATEDDLRQALQDKDLFIFSIRPQRGGGLFGFQSRRRRIRARDFIIFNQEMIALIHAGLPILRCLELLLERMRDPLFKQVISDVRERVEGGASLSEAFEAQSGLFNRVYTSALLAGEQSGDLERILRRYLSYLKGLFALRRKVLQALIYPAILIALSLGLATIMMTVVIPKFSQFYGSFGRDLPLITQVLVGTANFVRQNFFWLLLAVIAAIIALRFYARSQLGRLAVDGWKLNLPFAGRLQRQYAISQFTRTLATMLSGGIPLVHSLEVASGSIANALVRHRLAVVGRKVREGDSLHHALEGSGLIPPLAIEMVQVGEQTGSLEAMLVNISEFYDEEIESSLATFIAWLEPALLLFMGGLIAFMLIAMYLPLFRLITLPDV
ncbi:MAG TPA: type II secretion system F family protein [Acidobacteriota bacterium]